MSTGVGAIAHTDTLGHVIRIGQEGRASIDLRQETKETEVLIWQQVQDVLRATLWSTGLAEPYPSARQERTLSEIAFKRVTVAPGVLVSGHEYEERYGGFDVEQFKRQMSPELFKAFVRHIGVIPGDRDLDVNDLATIPD